MKLCSELALLLVPIGEPETLTDLLLVDPDLALYTDGGMFVINGRKLLGMLRLISMCLKAISRDFFDIVLPKPMLSGEVDDFPLRLLLLVRRSSCFGGASFLALTTRSTILLPIRTGLTLSPPFKCGLRTAGTELPLWPLPFGALPLEGEQDCRLGLTIGSGTMEDDLEIGAPGLPRQAEDGLSGNDVLRFGGASREKPGISDGFHALDLTGEVPRDGAELLLVVWPDFKTGEDRADGALLEGRLDDRLVGVAGLGAGLLGADREGLDVGVEGLVDDGTEDLMDVDTEDLIDGSVEDLVGADVLRCGTTCFVGVDGLEGLVVTDEVTRPVGVVGLEGFEVADEVTRPVGVVGLEGFEVADEVARPVGVTGLDGLEVADEVERPVGVGGLDAARRPPDDDSLRVPILAELKPDDEVTCLDVKMFLDEESAEYANLDLRTFWRDFGVPACPVGGDLLHASISKHGNSGVPGGVMSQS